MNLWSGFGSWAVNTRLWPWSSVKISTIEEPLIFVPSVWTAQICSLPLRPKRVEGCHTARFGDCCSEPFLNLFPDVTFACHGLTIKLFKLFSGDISWNVLSMRFCECVVHAILWRMCSRRSGSSIFIVFGVWTWGLKSKNISPQLLYSFWDFRDMVQGGWKRKS